MYAVIVFTELKKIYSFPDAEREMLLVRYEE